MGAKLADRRNGERRRRRDGLDHAVGAARKQKSDRETRRNDRRAAGLGRELSRAVLEANGRLADRCERPCRSRAAASIADGDRIEERRTAIFVGRQDRIIASR